MAKKRLTKLEQMGIIALVVIITFFFYVKKVYEPECKRFEAARKKSVKLTKEIKNLKWEEGEIEDILSSISKKEKELRKVESELEKIATVLADKEDLSTVLTRISRLAGEHNLKIREFSPADAPVTKFDKKADITASDDIKRNLHNLVISGRFLDLKEFLKDMGLLPKLVTVEKIVVERKTEEEELSINLLLSI